MPRFQLGIERLAHVLGNAAAAGAEVAADGCRRSGLGARQKSRAVPSPTTRTRSPGSANGNEARAVRRRLGDAVALRAEADDLDLCRF